MAQNSSPGHRFNVIKRSATGKLDPKAAGLGDVFELAFVKAGAVVLGFKQVFAQVFLVPPDDELELVQIVGPVL